MLSARLESLPLVVCGPILRRTDDQSVTVWVALRKARTVRLEVYAETQGGGWTDTVLHGDATTARVGDNLHILAITAKSGSLSWGKRYAYNLFFAEIAGAAPDDAGVGELFAPAYGGRTGVVAASTQEAKALLTYGPDGPSLPSFVLPPGPSGAGGASPINGLRIVHGSCRKAHGQGEDALPILDDMIRASLASGATAPRPHMLLLTGDQIYADDVADALLALVIDAGKTLVGWPVEAENKTLPGPGFRSDFAKAIGLSGMEGPGGESATTAKSHLMRFSEFAAMYLFAWSDVLWPAPNQVPTLEQVFVNLSAKQREKRAELFEKERLRLQGYRATLPKVRRALANTPTYMIFDDHEVTDDWNLTSGWERKVYQRDNVGGRRHVLNGLLAYALFQAWGNTPEQFETKSPDTPGGKLLKALSLWRGHPGETHEAMISACLNIPVYDGRRRAASPAYEDILHWHYDIQTPGFQCLVLDTRTMRGFPGGPDDPPDQLDDLGFERQIRGARRPSPPADMTMVVATTNVVSEPVTEAVVEISGMRPPVAFDRGDAWTGQTPAFERLLVELAYRTAPASETHRRAHFAIATGDIHYGFAVRGQYWSSKGGYRPADAPWPDGGKLEVVFAEFTSSPFHNQDFKTGALHNYAFGSVADVQFLGGLMNASWIGWRKPPKRSDLDIKPDPQPSTLDWLANPALTKLAVEVRKYRTRRREELLASTPALLRLNGFPAGSLVSKAPDWAYRLDFIMDETPSPMAASIPPATGSDKARARQMDALTGAYGAYADEAAGRILVGRNNIGEIRFEWPAGDNKALVQKLWWRLVDGAVAQPLTEYRVPFGFQEPAFPKPTYPGEQ
ncbi:hypothetical protein SGCZBJ_17715 [Caulobacter zeae]|uniref:PhoD-like phosphatase metallophosphatase domain-containing protein n=1 Tax=Caulobacter zeae TaxID=2055137 RepID=A0A2N5D971_9CAUL|nr:hypothetical protein [Caulobacter zeae]PLR22614.1 hypothetical protein SGCZBJ_17715 [Caulobacter zeae]